MKRVISLYLPAWPLDRLYRHLGHAAPPPDRPVILIRHAAHGDLVAAANAAAHDGGARPGMTVSQAQSLVPRLAGFPADETGDQAALHRLTRWVAARIAPLAAPDPPDGIWIDATGTAHLYGGELPMLHHIVTGLARVGITARAAMARSGGAAHALARFRAAPVLTAGDETDLLSDLPIAALRLPDDMIDDLRRLGFETIGALHAQPRAPLALRFGARLGQRLDQAFGRLDESITPIAAPPPLQSRRQFADPIATGDAIAHHIAHLVRTLCARLEAQSLGARQIDLACHLVDHRIVTIHIGTVKATRDHARIMRLLRDKMTDIDPGFGIEHLVLTATQADRLTYHPAAHDLHSPARPDLAPLIDRLRNRVGADKIYHVFATESEIPERSVRRHAVFTPPPASAWPLHWPRPVRLLHPPEPITTLSVLPDYPPPYFNWRGSRHHVAQADGPERLYGEWADHDAEYGAVRDYFQVETDLGARFWLFRAGDGENPDSGSHDWFLHGVFA